MAKKAAAQGSLKVAMQVADKILKVSANGPPAMRIATGVAAAVTFVGVAAGYGIYRRFRPKTPPESPTLPPRSLKRPRIYPLPVFKGHQTIRPRHDALAMARPFPAFSRWGVGRAQASSQAVAGRGDRGRPGSSATDSCSRRRP